MATISYTGQLFTGGYLDGTTIENTEDLNFRVGSKQVALCIDLAVRQMQVGDRARVTCVPDHLIQVADEPVKGPVTALKPKAVVKYTVTLTGLQDDVRESLRQLQVGDEASQADSAPEARIKIHNEADGQGELPKKGDTLMVHYSGMLTNGKVFDSSVTRGEPFIFKVGIAQVIDCWDIGFM